MLQEIESPCIGVCKLDSQQVCEGCFRTLDEIAAWAGANPERRLEILGAVLQRKQDKGA